MGSLRLINSLLFLSSLALCQDDVGFKNGLINITTSNWQAKIIKDSGTLVSLQPTGSDFDFLPYDFMLAGKRLQNTTYEWGDITIRYREACSKNWTSSDSAYRRIPVNHINTGALAAHELSPTLSNLTNGPLRVVREWIDVAGDLGVKFTISNNGNKSVEIGSLGIPAAVNNIFTKRNASNMYQKCSFMDPYIGLDAGYLRVTPISGVGPVLVVTPLGDTPLEAYRYLQEESHGDTSIGSNAFEGFFEWQVHSKAYAQNEWKGVDPWNLASAVTLKPGQSREYALRLTVVRDGVRSIDAALRTLDSPTAIGIPGYIIPRDSTGKLYLQSSSSIASISVVPQGSVEVIAQGNKTYIIQPSVTAWGRVRLTVRYENNKLQTIHYYITKSASAAVRDLGKFITTKHWFNDTSDPFGRAPSIMAYDNDVKAIVEQDSQIMVAGLSDEGGAGAYVALAVKQTFQPQEHEISRIETFIDEVLFNKVQDRDDYGVKRGLFFYEPTEVPGYNYSSSFKWNTAMDKDYAYETNRAYNYVWPAAAYWALYRVGRAFPDLLKAHDSDWYIDQSFKTILRGMQSDVAYNNKGLMGETVIGELLADLMKENRTDEADQLIAAMKNRVDAWSMQEYPFGSEQAWDCTGQEGVYYWAKYFGEDIMRDITMNSVLGYMPTVPHWAYNGNARRYWDFSVTGKLKTIERQIHHYGSGLNALIMLSAFRDNTSDSYLLRVGYGGTSGPLANINQEGYAACAMHAWPEHLFWDGYSGDYGPNFVGMTLGSGTYLVDDQDLGMLAFGGTLEVEEHIATVRTRDPVRQRIFVGPIGVEFKIDAGVIETFSYDLDTKAVSLKLSQLDDGPLVKTAVLWISSEASVIGNGGVEQFSVVSNGVIPETERQGYKIPLSAKGSQIYVDIL